MTTSPFIAQGRHFPARQIEISEQELWCDHRGIAWMPDWKALVVSDLHLEKGSAMARRGVMLPPYDTAESLSRLERLIDDYSPEIVVCLGDNFHDDDGPVRIAPVHRERLLGLMNGRQWFWISGNHDEAPPEGLPGDSVEELAMGGLTFRHVPGIGTSGEIAGHLHPGARIVRRGRSVRRPCFATDGTRLVMPAFGAFTGMLNVLDHAYHGLFGGHRPTAYVMGRQSIYRIVGDLLQPG
jgi:DNA ligase-associated metallophosphoesterase